jgi:hypothetical protein
MSLIERQLGVCGRCSAEDDNIEVFSFCFLGGQSEFMFRGAYNAVQRQSDIHTYYA